MPLTGFRITVPAPWSLKCVSCDGEIRPASHGPKATMFAWVKPTTTGGLVVLHDTEHCNTWTGVVVGRTEVGRERTTG